MRSSLGIASAFAKKISLIISKYIQKGVMSVFLTIRIIKKRFIMIFALKKGSNGNMGR